MRTYPLALPSRQRTPRRDLAHEAVTRIKGLKVSLDALEAERAAATNLRAGT
jgi:hypothetical protein